MTSPDALPWGRRFLLCPPRHFDVSYRINPWMRAGAQIDHERAELQWEALAATLRTAGAQVDVLDPVAGLPDLVFTANAGVVDGRRFVPSRFRHPERRGETAHDVAWFAAHGWAIEELPEGVVHEGAGDALPFAGTLVVAHGDRSDAAAGGALARLTGAPVQPVGLVDERLYHLDLTFCPLDGRRAMVAPFAWDPAGRRALAELVPEPIVLDEEAAYRFCANSVVVERTVVMPDCTPALGRRLEAAGFEVAVVDVSEFVKAGGACRCLTLALDVKLSAGPGGGRL